ncbi:MAG: response regulator [Candidatus Thermoplasmatota archaeon]
MKKLLGYDKRSFQDQVEAFLERVNHDIELFTSSTVEKALEMLDEKAFDMVSSDYQMPEMNGIEFLKILHEARDDDIPFIMLTNKERKGVVTESSYPYYKSLSESDVSEL